MRSRSQWYGTLPRPLRPGVVVLLACAVWVVSFVWGDQPTAWQLLDDGDPNPGSGTLAYDTWRQRAVRTTTGGGDAPPFTWELVGEDWVRRFPPEPTPWGVGSACSAFDEHRGVVVFAGVDLYASVSETWEYDGQDWIQRFPATNPPARYRCGLVYDSARQRMVLFGGYSSGLEGLGDTWEYDGTDWTQVFPASSPSPRGDSGMAYDPDDGVVVLATGRNGGVRYRDTWEYDGQNWKNLRKGDLPFDRSAPGMTYDPVREKVVLFGGHSDGGDLNDTWEWDGKAWTEVVAPEAPAPRWRVKLVYDTERGMVVGHGGSPNDGAFNDTWAYDGATWSRIAESGLPPTRYYHALAYDPLVDAAVLYGGRKPAPDPYLTDTWHFSDGAWILQDLVGEPSASYALRMVFDEDGSRVIGYSGAWSHPEDVHEYAGVPRAWTSTYTGQLGPDGRASYGWTAAPALGGTLLFGGNAWSETLDAYYYANDTWVLQGLQWTEHNPADRPSPRHDMGLTFHESIGKAVLYAGRDTGSPVGFADTWLYDGQDWQRILEVSPPGDRYGPSLSYDDARDRTVLFGGGPPLEGVTWEFDGSQWIARSTPFQPDSKRCWSQLAYDSTREVVLVFGGRYCGTEIFLNDTWAYGPDPDGDGIVGGLDNCRDTPNEDQANGDGDPAGDVCDCAPGDPGSYVEPAPVTGLRVDGKASTSITWDDQAPRVGEDVTYDLVSGSLQDLRAAGDFSAASCLAPGLSTPGHTDDRTPVTGDGFYYLARASNVCGVGTYGAGREGLDAASPCP